MKEFIEKQRFLKGLVIVVVILVIFTLLLFWVYYFEKPSGSNLHITGYSEIIYDRDNCQSFRPTLDTWEEFFPIVLQYKSPNAYASFQTEDGYFAGQLKISGVEAVYLTSQNNSFEVPHNGSVLIDIQAHAFRWDSEVQPSDFDDVRLLEYNRLFGYLEDDGGIFYDDIFNWIKPFPLRFSAGFCAKDLVYYPDRNGVYFTNLSGFAMSAIPETSYADRSALLLEFNDAISLSINNKSYPVGGDIQFRVTQKNLFDRGYPSFNLVATGLDEKDVAICDSFTIIKPGFICARNMDITQKSFAEYFSGMAGRSQSITLTSPEGWGELRFIKSLIPKETDQLTVSSNLDYVQINQKSDVLTLTGNRISAKANGVELFPSLWEKLPNELKAVWVTLAVSILTGFIGFGVQRSSEVNRFWKWFSTKPVYKPPVMLHQDAYIFKLINGKKISGIIDTLEGKSTFRVFVLKEVREWDKDNWSEVLPTEVRVPQNQIEMYYKAHP